MHLEVHSGEISAASMAKSTSILYNCVTPLCAVAFENCWVFSKILLVLAHRVPWCWKIRFWSRSGRRMMIRSIFNLQLAPKTESSSLKIEQLAFHWLSGCVQSLIGSGYRRCLQWTQHSCTPFQRSIPVLSRSGLDFDDLGSWQFSKIWAGICVPDWIREFCLFQLNLRFPNGQRHPKGLKRDGYDHFWWLVGASCRRSAQFDLERATPYYEQLQGEICP